MPDRKRGLYGKFIVSRADGTDRPGGKHDGCEYFVIDITHDPFATVALRAYAKACEKDGYTELAKDLRARLRKGKPL